MIEERAPPKPPVMQPVLARMRSLAPCPADLEKRVHALGARIEKVAAKTVLSTEDTPALLPSYLVAGWACRYRYLPDGRRQIFDLVLPGDGLGVCLHPRPIAITNTLALTPLTLVGATSLLQGDHDNPFAPILRAQANADEQRALRQIMRLGRMTALERLADMFAELHQRLEVVGMTKGARFACPLTQESLADVMGLSVVHVNRMLKELSKRNLVVVGRGFVDLRDLSQLAKIADNMPQRFYC